MPVGETNSNIKQNKEKQKAKLIIPIIHIHWGMNIELFLCRHVHISILIFISGVYTPFPLHFGICRLTLSSNPTLSHSKLQVFKKYGLQRTNHFFRIIFALIQSEIFFSLYVL